MEATPEDFRSLQRLLVSLDPERKKELIEQPAVQAVLRKKAWTPFPGPQTMAYESEADVLLYGGAAGGGKSGLIVGLALRAHQRSLVMRRQYSELSGIIEDTLAHYGTRDGFNGSPPAKLRTADGRLIEFGGAKLPGDEQSWKGQPHDLLAIDEASEWNESQVRFLMGWVRTTVPGQRCRTVLATNPPHQQGQGQWLREMFGPWLDPEHPAYRPGGEYGREPGELLWVVTDGDGKDQWVDGPEPVEIDGRSHKPMSRTFIPARLRDNPALVDSNYGATLDGLLEPLRSAVRDGNWLIAHTDHEDQVIPTAWIMAAQDRWTEDGWKDHLMTAMALDCSGGGRDAAVLAYRHGGWVGPMVVVEGGQTADGAVMASTIMRHRRDGAAIVVDVGGGYAGATIERLRDNKLDFTRFDGASRSALIARGTNLGFVNKRAEALWRLREALDPEQEGGSIVALPREPGLLGELSAARYRVELAGIRIEPKERIIARLGRSPNMADAVMMCLSEGGKAASRVFRRQPKVILGYQAAKRRK